MKFFLTYLLTFSCKVFLLSSAGPALGQYYLKMRESTYIYTRKGPSGSTQI